MLNVVILRKLEEKMAETNSHSDEIARLAQSFAGHRPDSITTGIVAGRLYNTFYYQTRRVLRRDPTHDEFMEFVEFVRHIRPNC